MNIEHPCLVCLIPTTADLELGLKKDTMPPLDGSSLEALLKGEPLDKRGPPELRGPEEDASVAEITATPSHTGSTRIRKVRRCTEVCLLHVKSVFI